MTDDRAERELRRRTDVFWQAVGKWSCTLVAAAHLGAVIGVSDPWYVRFLLRPLVVVVLVVLAWLFNRDEIKIRERRAALLRAGTPEGKT